jgi:predicted DNA-binding protein
MVEDSQDKVELSFIASKEFKTKLSEAAETSSRTLSSIMRNGTEKEIQRIESLYEGVGDEE